MRSRQSHILWLLIAWAPACSLSHNVDLPGSDDNDSDPNIGLDSGAGAGSGFGSGGEENPHPGAGGTRPTGIECDFGGAGGFEPANPAKISEDADAPEQGNGDLDATAHVPISDDDLPTPSDCSLIVVK